MAARRDPARLARRLGLTGALLMAVGSLGAGALPVPNPLNGLRLIGLPARNATLAIALTYAGMGMLVLAWLWIGRMLSARGAIPPAPDRVSLGRTGILWAIPLAMAPPMFSKDVYSYLAQSAIMARGLDPYVLGPAQALGVDDPLTRTIPTIWRDTPAPYGPLFIAVGRGITALTGNDVVFGVLAHRALALVGVGLIVWALPKLARRCGMEPGLALWLGAANPLVLFHLVSGIHNEALMIGLLLAGLHLALGDGARGVDPRPSGGARGVDRRSSGGARGVDPRPSDGARRVDRRSGPGDAPVPWARWVAGAALITLGGSVKLPALLALGFVGMDLARQWGGRFRDVARAAGLLGAVAVGVYLVIGFGTGLGFGWIHTQGTANEIRSWMSLSTDLGQLSGQVGILAGLGDHTDTTLAITRGIGGIAIAAVVAWLLWLCLKGRVEPVTGVGVGLGAVVLLGPVVHPWYLLWAAIPLAATRGMPRYRRFALAASAVIALMVPPTGADFNFRAYQLPFAILAGAVMLLVALVVLRELVRRESGAESGPDAEIRAPS
ncbi:alpha-1,6-mannosyltransferase [Pseudonocardia oroxyli]|uniref:Alpha-1,6-mannosyltransferase n=1 Tax=Pseudonocardia oroxyli TaxID=366584 RepID=A0A1G7HX42_PSEOR|nr:alpha-1,6-mannosyltransferase [Pseudonocardia oroxyli]